MEQNRNDEVKKLTAEEEALKDLRADIRFIKTQVLKPAYRACSYAKSNYCY